MSQKQTALDVTVDSLLPATLQVWGKKQGGRWKTWKRRLFIIKDNKVWYFAQKSDTTAKGFVELPAGVEIEDLSKTDQKDNFRLSINSKGIKGPRKFIIKLDTSEEFQSFLQALREVTSITETENEPADNVVFGLQVPQHNDDGVNPPHPIPDHDLSTTFNLPQSEESAPRYIVSADTEATTHPTGTSSEYSQDYMFLCNDFPC